MSGGFTLIGQKEGYPKERIIDVNKLRDTKQRSDGFVPYERSVEDIIGEDKLSEPLYRNVFEEDDEIQVTGNDFDPVCIDNWTSCVQLNKLVLKNVENCSYVRPRKIQSYVIPLIFEGHDICAQAETGSGKTVAYLVPLISMIEDEHTGNRPQKELHMPRAIIIGPTRELIIQLFEQAKKLSIGTSVKVKVAYGEYDYLTNSTQIFDGCDILVATYGRLLHFINDSVVGLDRLKYLVLDEADCLMEDTFKKDYERMIGINGFSKDKLQTLLFSATYPVHDNNWIGIVLKPKYITIKNTRANIPNSRITQTFEECPGNKKITRLLEYIQEIIKKHREKTNDANSTPRILVFVDRCQKSDAYAIFLNNNKIPTLSLNSKRGQRVREETLEAFRKSLVSVVVATDVCARGLEIKNLDYIINVDLPTDFATYVMRVGRTGRLKHGYAHSFFDPVVNQGIASHLIRALNHQNITVPEFVLNAEKSTPRMFPVIVIGQPNPDPPAPVQEARAQFRPIVAPPQPSSSVQPPAQFRPIVQPPVRVQAPAVDKSLGVQMVSGFD